MLIVIIIITLCLGTPGAPSQPEPDILFDVGVSPAAPNSAQPPTQNNGPNGGSK